MIPALLLSALSIVPHSEPIDSRAEIAQLDSVYTDDGDPTFTQAIWWREHDDLGTRVACWKLVKDGSYTPRRFGKGWQQLFISDGHFIRVRSRSFVRSWQQRDVEWLDREKLPVEMRRGF